MRRPRVVAGRARDRDPRVGASRGKREGARRGGGRGGPGVVWVKRGPTGPHGGGSRNRRGPTPEAGKAGDVADEGPGLWLSESEATRSRSGRTPARGPQPKRGHTDTPPPAQRRGVTRNRTDISTMSRRYVRSVRIPTPVYSGNSGFIILVSQLSFYYTKNVFEKRCVLRLRVNLFPKRVHRLGSGF